MTEPTDFEAVFAILKKHSVKFVVIGGLCARAYLSNYITMDVDICYDRDSTNLERLAKALKEMKAVLRLRNAPANLPFKPDAKTLAGGLNFTFETELGPVNILGEVEGVGGYREALHEIRMMPEFNVPILSLKNLVAAKKAAGRPKDLNVLLELQLILMSELRLGSGKDAPWRERIAGFLQLYRDRKIERYLMVIYVCSVALEADLDLLMKMLDAELIKTVKTFVQEDPSAAGYTENGGETGASIYIKLHDYFFKKK